MSIWLLLLTILENLSFSHHLQAEARPRSESCREACLRALRAFFGLESGYSYRMSKLDAADWAMTQKEEEKIVEVSRVKENKSVDLFHAACCQ